MHSVGYVRVRNEINLFGEKNDDKKDYVLCRFFRQCGDSL